MSGRFWPICEPAQADYEQLRAIVLTGGDVGEILAARRFARRGLAGLISWPSADPAYLGSVIGARRPPWCGCEDPRERQLRDTYAFLLAVAVRGEVLWAVGEWGSGSTRACRASASRSAARSARNLTRCAPAHGLMGMR